MSANQPKTSTWKQGRFRTPGREGDCANCGEHWQRHHPLDGDKCPKVA